MSAGLPTHLVVSALLRRVNNAGGIGVVRARGDDQSGTILVLTSDRGTAPRIFERGTAPDGTTALLRSGPGDEAPLGAVEEYWKRRRARDPDLWVVELDIAEAERFAAETILGD